MSKLSKYLEENYERLKEIAYKITSEKSPDKDDLLHETIVSLYSSDKKKIDDLIENRKLLFWIARIMVNQYHSKTSPYWYKYRKYYKKINEKFVLGCWQDQYINNTPSRLHRIIQEDGIEAKKQIEKGLEEIDKKLKKIHWLDSEVFRIYYLGEVNGKQFSLNSMEKETGISKSTLYKSIKKVKKILKC